MLKEAFKKTIKHAAIFGLGRVSSRIIGLILIPIYTRFIIPSDYGILAIVTMIGTIATIALEMGQCTAIFRYYFLFKEEEKRKVVISNVFFWTLVVGMIIAVVLLLTSEFVSTIFLQKPIFAPYLILIYLTAYTRVLKNIPLSVMRAREKSVLYSVLSVIDLILGIILNIYFVVILKRGIQGILEAGLIVGVLTAPIFFLFIREDIRLHISLRILKRLLKFGIPLVPASLASLVLTLSNRYFLTIYASLEDVGLYTLGQKIGIIISIMLVQPFQLIWPTMMYTIYGKKEAGEFYSRVLNYYLIAVGGIALVMSIFAQEIVAVLAAETYLEAYRVIPLIAFSYVAYGTYFVTTVGLNLREKTYYLPWIVGAAAAVNLLLNYLLVPPYGMMGAAVAVFLSHIVLVVINYFVNQRFYRVTYDIRKICLLCLFFVFTIFLFSCPITVSILVKVLYVCVYCIFTWMMLLDEKERRNLLDMTPFSIYKNTRKNS